jgi:predicted transcriptional regulator of viral defense system
VKAAQIVNTLLQENGGIISTADVIKAGISRMTVSQFVKDGRLERIAHGRYIQPDSFPDELYIMQMRSENIIFSHETALFFAWYGRKDACTTLLNNAKRQKTVPCIIWRMQNLLYKAGITWYR